MLFNKGAIHAVLGDKKEAVESLRQAVDNGWMAIHYVDELLRPHGEMYNLRDDPQFQAVRAELAKKVADLEKQF